MAKPGGSKYKWGLCSHFVPGIFFFLRAFPNVLPAHSFMLVHSSPSRAWAPSVPFPFPLAQAKLAGPCSPCVCCPRVPRRDAIIQHWPHDETSSSREVGEPVAKATDWFAKCKQSAAVQGEERACPQSVINLSNRSWCMSYISTLTCETPKSQTETSFR